MRIAVWNLRRRRRSNLRCNPKAGRRITNLALFGGVFAAVSDPGSMAHAYLDPGTGGLILQMLLGGVAGVLVVAKLYWHQFTSLFRRNGKQPKASAESRPE